jgi:hypothetical protein
VPMLRRCNRQPCEGGGGCHSYNAGIRNPFLKFNGPYAGLSPTCVNLLAGFAYVRHARDMEPAHPRLQTLCHALFHLLLK